MSWPTGATAAFLLPSAIAMVTLSCGYAPLAGVLAVAAGVRGMLAVVVGLLPVTLYRLGQPVINTRDSAMMEASLWRGESSLRGRPR